MTILVNERLQHMLGYSFDEIVGKSPQAYMAPEFKVVANERLIEHMGGMKQVIDYRFLKKDGSYLWCILSSTPLFDKNGETRYMNDAVQNVIGDFDYLVKSNLEERIEVLKSTDLNGDKIDIKETNLYIALNSGKTTRDFNVMTKINSGKIIYSSHSGAPIRNNIGEIAGAVIIHKDITERVELEKKTDKLVEELRIADKNKNAFINMLSHELRNPLASIMMGLELLEKAPPGGKQASMALDIAKRQGKQLTNLVFDLLDVTRISQNKISLKKESLEINDLIDKAVQDYQSQFFDKEVKLEVNLTTPLYIEADYSRLTQVISNLLHNSAKFTEKNDLVIISVRQDTDNGEVIITVQDTGRGMDPKEQLNLFKPFVQVDKSLDRKVGGLGLGLSIVKGMVELHGGRVEVFSEGIGQGTKFTIGLPL